MNRVIPFKTVMILPELAPLSLKSRTLSMDKLSFGKENASSSLVPGMATCAHLACNRIIKFGLGHVLQIGTECWPLK